VEFFQDVDGLTGWHDGEYVDAQWGPLSRVNADCAVYVNL
jgi:hypothetical protein